MKKLGLIAFMCGLVLAISATAEALYVPSNEWTFDKTIYYNDGTTEANIYWTHDGVNVVYVKLVATTPLYGLFTFDIHKDSVSAPVNSFEFFVDNASEYTASFAVSALNSGGMGGAAEGELTLDGTTLFYFGMCTPPVAPPTDGDGANGDGGDGCVDLVGDPIPEPGTLLLIGSGLAGLAGYGRLRSSRRKRKEGRE